MDPVALARTISDDVLFPGALDVDASDIVPIERLNQLADAGLYGFAGPASAHGMGIADMATSRFDGQAPWVTGWGRIDVIRAAARREDGDIVWALMDHHAQRLAREALFLLVFGQTASIKAAQLDRLECDSA